MLSLILILISIGCAGGFLALTRYEEHRGARFFAAERNNLDRGIEHIELVFRNTDFAAYTAEGARRVVRRIGHDIAHLSLQIVRSIERLLTRLVRHFRTRQDASTVSGENVREFLQKLSAFKDKLKATRPEMTDVP